MDSSTNHISGHRRNKLSAEFLQLKLIVQQQYPLLRRGQILHLCFGSLEVNSNQRFKHVHKQLGRYDGHHRSLLALNIFRIDSLSRTRDILLISIQPIFSLGTGWKHLLVKQPSTDKRKTNQNCRQSSQHGCRQRCQLRQLGELTNDAGRRVWRITILIDRW